MMNFIKLLIEKQVIKVKQIVGKILQSEAYKILESFYHNQSWDLIKNGEVVLGYNDIKYFVNKDSDKMDVIIEQLYQTPEQQVHLVAAHKQYGHVDVLFTIDNFVLSANKATVTFSYHINGLKPFSDLDFLDKVKIYGASLAVKIFPGTVNNLIFNNKELSEGVRSTVLENKITIDFIDAVRQSPLSKNRVLGYQALDIVQVMAINIHENGFGIRFHIVIPDWLKSITLMLFSALIRKKVYKIPLLAPAPSTGSLLKKLLPL